MKAFNRVLALVLMGLFSLAAYAGELQPSPALVVSAQCGLSIESRHFQLATTFPHSKISTQQINAVTLSNLFIDPSIFVLGIESQPSSLLSSSESPEQVTGYLYRVFLTRVPEGATRVKGQTSQVAVIEISSDGVLKTTPTQIELNYEIVTGFLKKNKKAKMTCQLAVSVQ